MSKEREIASIINVNTQDILAVKYEGEMAVLTDAYTGEKHGKMTVNLLQEAVDLGWAYKVFCYKDELPWD